MATENTEVRGCTLVLKPGITQLGVCASGDVEVSLDLEGTTLVASIGGAEARVNLESLVTATTADRFVRSGRFDAESQALVLTTATADGDEQDVSIDMTALFNSLTAVQGEKGDTGEKGEKGDTGEAGTSITVAGSYESSEGVHVMFSDGSEVVIPKATASGSGECCFPELETKELQDGTKLVAVDANGQPYIIASGATNLTDVAVDVQLASSTYINGRTKSVVNVKVTNVKNEAVTGVSYVFATGADISDGASTDETIDLDAFETKTYTYTIEHDENTYVNATVSVANDTDSSNNSKTLAIAAKTPASDTTVNNVFTDQCPMASGYVVGYEDSPLIFRAQTKGLEVGSNQNTNVIKRANLKGLQIQFTNVSSVIVKGDDPTNYNSDYWAQLAYRYNSDRTSVESSFLGTATQIRETITPIPTNYSFDASTGLFTFGENYEYPYALIFIRTSNGDTCLYQSVWINASDATVEVTGTHDTYSVSGINSSNYRISTYEGDDVNTATNYNKPVSVELEGFTGYKVNFIGFGDMTGYRVLTGDADEKHYAQVRSVPDYDENGDPTYEAITLNTKDRLDISLPAGQAYNFTITGDNSGVNETAGDITILRKNKTLAVSTTEAVAATNNVVSKRITISFV